MAVAEDLSLPRDLSETRAELRRARHLPGYVYDSPEIFALEKEKIFLKDWLALARVEEIERPGDYMTFRVLGEPVVVCRDRDGAINAFANVCAHRGVEVAAGSGNTGEFSCPYHGWLYDLQGKLIGAPYMKEAEGFDPAACRLKPLRSGTWAGWVFVNFDDAAMPLERHVAFFEEAFGFFRMQDCRLGSKHTTDVDCNWKFVNENLMDVYHFQTLHAETFGAHLDGEQFAIKTTARGDVSAFYDAAPITPEGKSLLGTIPWLEGEVDEKLGCMGYLTPHLHMFGRCDMSLPMTIEPLAPDRTRINIYFLYPGSRFDEDGFADKIKVYHDFGALVLDEDRSMVQGMQRNMASRHFVPGPMSKLERTVHDIVNGYLERVFDA